MTRKHFTATLLLALSGVLIAASAAHAEKTYTVRFNRPMKVGQQFRQNSTASETHLTQVIADDKVVQQQDEKVEVEYEAQVRIEAVDKTGRPTKVTHVVEKLVKTVNGATAEVLGKGTVVVADTADDKARFRIGDHAPAPELDRLLTLVIHVRPDEPAEDELFPCDKPCKVGETWPMDTKVAADFITRSGLKVEPAAITGGGKLEEVAPVSGVPCMVISGDMTINNLPLPLQGKLEMQESQEKLNYRVTLPIDAQAPPMEDTRIVSLTFTAHDPSPTKSAPTATAVVPPSIYKVEVHRETRSQYQFAN